MGQPAIHFFILAIAPELVCPIAPHPHMSTCAYACRTCTTRVGARRVQCSAGCASPRSKRAHLPPKPKRGLLLVVILGGRHTLWDISSGSCQLSRRRASLQDGCPYWRRKKRHQRGCLGTRCDCCATAVSRSFLRVDDSVGEPGDSARTSVRQGRSVKAQRYAQRRRTAVPSTPERKPWRSFRFATRT